MALPAHASTGLLPSESESLALQTQRILILPTRALDKVRLMQGTFGPFRPARTCSVPLWLALHLKRKRKARIVCPDWLSVDSLKSSLRHETTSDSFCSLPLHYPSIARALIDDASDDIPDASLVRSLLKDLREARQAKIMQGLSDVNCWHLEMSNISHSELCELRPFINRAFDDLKRLLP
ncbi:DNA replication complex GINS protein PSF2, partial [Ceraceosorus guamensis]